MKRHRTAVGCLICLLSITTAHAAESRPRQLLEQALQEYRTALDAGEREERLEHFHRAELLFQRVVDGNKQPGRDALRNADLYVNLGNAAMGAEHLGPAVLAYRRALLLDPDHARALQNLRHVRTLLPDWVPRPEEGGLWDTFFSFCTRMSESERQTAAGIFFIIACVLLAASIRWRRNWLKNLAWFPAAVCVFFLGTLLLQRTHDDTVAAVVIVSEVVARSADSMNAPARFSQPLPSGTEVAVLESRDTWTHIRLPDARDAWLPTSSLRLIQ